MIIDYDHNQNLNTDRKLDSLKESVQMALNENDAEHKGFRALLDKVNSAINSIKSQIIDILNRLGQDFIVEQGTSGIWTYRKWNSGIAECWYSNSFTVNFDTLAANNLRTSTTTNSVAIPSLLTSVTEYNVSGYNTSSAGWATLVAGGISGSNIVLSYMGWTTAGNKTVAANIYIKGKWK